MRNIFLWATFILVCVFITPNYAEIILFDDIPYDSQTFHNPIYDPGYWYPTNRYVPGYSDGILDIDGYRFTGEHFHTLDLPAIHGISALGGAPENGSIYLNSERTWPIKMKRIDGRPFSLIDFDGAESFVNVDLAMLNGYPTARVITVTGSRLDGTELTESFSLDGINDGAGVNSDFQTFTLSSDWYNLTAVTFSGYDLECNRGGFSIDNINAIRGMIPEPSKVALNNRQLQVNGKRFRIKGVVYSPVPIGDEPSQYPYGDYFTSLYSDLHNRDLPLLRNMGTNTIRLLRWNSSANHQDFLESAYNEGIDPIYIIPEYPIGAGLDLDPTSPTNVREQIKADFRQMVAIHKNHPAILMWSIGSGLNASSMYGSSLDSLLSLVNEMAWEAHAEEGAKYHPVAVSLADENLIETVASYDDSLPSLDVWGANVYRGSTFGTLFQDFKPVTEKPLIILEYGIDAYDSTDAAEYEYLGIPYQSDYAASLWNEITTNSDVCIGATVMEYSDEWWKGSSANDLSCSDNGSAYHDVCGHATSSHPDEYSNEEWWGLMRAIANGSSPDDMEPRAAYYQLQMFWVEPAVSMTIDNDTSYTSSISVTLGMSCKEETGCHKMQFSNDNATWSTIMPYGTTVTWNLASGDGAKTVFARVTDVKGFWSRTWANVFSDSILLDTTRPVTAASPAAGAYTTIQQVTLTCSDVAGSGCNKTYYTTDGSTPTTSSGVYSGPLDLAETTTLKYFSTDLAGNQESVKTQSYSFDTTPPTGSVTINNGASHTRSTGSTLTLSCSDDTRCYQMILSNDNLTWSSPATFAATRTWTLASGQGEKTVYVKFRDTAGNWSNIFSDSIVLDTTRPVTAASPAAGTYTTIQQVTLTCSDVAGSGCDKTYFTTDGSTPTTSSGVYSGSMSLSSSTILRYFSTDLAGNQESVKSQTYTINLGP